MKKVIIAWVVTGIILLAAVVSGAMMWNGGDNNDTYDGIETGIAPLTWNNVVSADREFMYLNYKDKGDIKWFESQIRMKDFFDSENQNDTIDMMVNIFEVVGEEGEPWEVFALQHKDTIHTNKSTLGLWVGDNPLNDEDIVVSFNEALQKIYECNYPIPHGRYCTLRKEVGSKPGVNPQWIFGNKKAQLYVNAVTGEVTDKNPAYNSNDEDK